jgi:serine protease Do
VLDVLPRGAGASAGILPGDIILKAGERTIATSGELAAIVTLASPGRRLVLAVWRDGKPLTLSAVLGSVGPEPASRTPPQPTPGPLGLVLRSLEASERRMIGLAIGLLVEFASDPARNAGIRQGDVLLAVNSHPVATIEHFRAALAQADNPVALLIIREGERMFVPVRLP